MVQFADNSFKFFAKYFNELGLNTLPITNKYSKSNFFFANRLKRPALDESEYFTGQVNPDLYNQIEWDKCTGLGATIGYEGLLAIDIDGSVEVELVKLILTKLGLPESYEWCMRSGSKAGFHILIKCPNFKHSRNYEEDSWALRQPHLPNREIKSFPSKPINIAPQWEGPVFPKRKEEFPVPHFYSGHENYVSKAQYDLSDFELESSRKIPLTYLFDKIEIITKGFLVLPPSIHESGSNYEFVHAIPSIEPTTVHESKLHDLLNTFCQTPTNIGSMDYNDAFVDNSRWFEQHKNIRYIILDVETNGLIKSNPSSEADKYPDIVQICWMMVTLNGTVIHRKSHILDIRPFEQENSAFKIHGIDEKLMETIGSPVKTVLRDLKNDIINTKATVVAHNVSFDIDVLKGNFKKYGFDVSFFEDVDTYCTMKKFQEVIEGIKPSSSLDYRLNRGSKDFLKFKSLTEAYNHLFFTNIDSMHNAIFDVTLCKKILFKLLKQENPLLTE